MVTLAARDLRPLAPVSVAVAVWGLGYALYRGYYALGGTVLLPGTLADPIQFRLINAAAVAILTIAALLPIAMLAPVAKTKGTAGTACGLLAGRGGLRHACPDRQHRTSSQPCRAASYRVPHHVGLNRPPSRRSAGPVLQRAVVFA